MPREAQTRTETVDVEADGYVFPVNLRPKSQGDPVYLVDFTRPDGERRRWSTGGKTLESAREYLTASLARVEREIRAGADAARPLGATSKNPRLSELIDYYTKTYLPNQGAKEKSIYKARFELREFEEYCQDHHIGRLQQISRVVVESYAAHVRERGRHAKTIKNRIATIRACFNAAEEAELIDRSPVRKWTTPKVDDPEIQPLTIEQLGRVVKAVETHRPEIYNAVCWIAWTGARPEDTCQLKWSQVDTKHRSVSRVNAKSPKLKKYPICRSAAAAVERERKRNTGSEYVFTDEDGRPFTAHVLYRRFTRTFGKQEGRVPFERHVCLKDLRHTFGSVMVNDVGCPVPQVQVRMGHADIKTTMRYVKAAEGRQYDDALDRLAGTVLQGKPLKTAKR